MSSFTIPTCPLTLQEIADPVVDPEGNTYERSAITKWVTEHRNSPLTRTPLSLAQLVPNRVLADMIAEKKGTGSTPATAATTAPIDPNAPLAYALEPQATIGVCLANASDGEMIASVSVDAMGDSTDLLLHRRHIVVVLDVSGSMGSIATAKAEDGTTLEDGFTLLNLVQHATKTICHALAPHDRMSIIAFDTNSKLELSPTFMDAAGKASADRVITSLYPKASTNLWAGISMGIDTAVGEVDAFTSILVLTDGVPSNRGVDFCGSLRRKLAKSPMNGPISFFGFGYSLDSKLLKDLALVGGGSFGFIPDAGFVGTIFINAVSNLSTMVAVNAHIEFDSAAGIEAVGPLDSNLGKMKRLSEAGTSTKKVATNPMFNARDDELASPSVTQIPLGAFRYGQPITFVFKRRDPAAELPAATLVFTIIGGRVQRVAATHITEPLSGPGVRFEQLRTHASAAMLAAADRARFESEAGSISLSSLLAVPPEMESSTDPKMMALATDMKGQVQMSISRADWYQKWGIHYLYSLGMAHLWCERNNFKDASVQIYGGELFAAQQDLLNDVFMEVDPPTPGHPNRYGGGGYGRGGGGGPVRRAAHGPPVNMSARYNNSAGVCFTGDTVVTTLLDGATKYNKSMAELVRGDVVVSDAIGSIGVVDVIVLSKCEPGETRVVRLGATLSTTEYHPVRKAATAVSTSEPNAAWQFPIDIQDSAPREVDFVYSVMLTEESRVPSLLIDGYECSTLAHGCTDDAVISHEYFGSELVRRDLTAHMNYKSEGRILVTADDIIRSESTGRIVSIVGRQSDHCPELCPTFVVADSDPST